MISFLFITMDGQKQTQKNPITSQVLLAEEFTDLTWERFQRQIDLNPLEYTCN